MENIPCFILRPRNPGVYKSMRQPQCLLLQASRVFSTYAKLLGDLSNVSEEMSIFCLIFFLIGTEVGL